MNLLDVRIQSPFFFLQLPTKHTKTINKHFKKKSNIRTRKRQRTDSGESGSPLSLVEQPDVDNNFVDSSIFVSEDEETQLPLDFFYFQFPRDV